MENAAERELGGPVEITPEQARESILLLRRLRDGDNTAYEEINRQYKTRLYRTAFRILRNDAAAEDAVQDALLLAFSRIHSFDGRSSFYTWMTTILTNCCFGELRKRRRRPIMSLEDAFDGDNSWTEQIESTQSRVDDLMICNEQVAVLNEAVEALQPDHKFILHARSELDLPLTEIAKQLGISLAAVKSRALRARRLCVQNARTLVGEEIYLDGRRDAPNKRSAYQRNPQRMPLSELTGMASAG